MEQSDSENLQPPSLDGVFARKRRERAERQAGLQPVTPRPAPTPIPPQAATEPADTPLDDEPEATEPEPPDDPSPAVTETVVLTRVIDEPDPARTPSTAKKATKQRAPQEPKPQKVRPPKAAKPPKVATTPTVRRPARTRRIPAFIPTSIAGACSGGVLVALVAIFNRWGGQTDTINAFELLGAFVAAIVVGYLFLLIARIAHRAAISFLGVGMVAVILMFFPSDRWQTVLGGIIVIVATAVAYAAAHAISREATSAR